MSASWSCWLSENSVPIIWDKQKFSWVLNTEVSWHVVDCNVSFARWLNKSSETKIPPVNCKLVRVAWNAQYCVRELIYKSNRKQNFVFSKKDDYQTLWRTCCEMCEKKDLNEDFHLVTGAFTECLLHSSLPKFWYDRRWEEDGFGGQWRGTH